MPRRSVPSPVPDADPASDPAPAPPAAALCFGLILPAAGFAAELATGMFGRLAIAPFPTPLYVGAAVLAMLGVAVAFGLGAARAPQWLPGRVVALGYAGGAALTYCLLFIPALPIIAIGCVVGLGVLAAAPYWSLLGCVMLHRHLLGCWRAAGHHPTAYAGLLLAGGALFPTLVLAEAQRTEHVEQLLREAVYGEPAVAAQAVRDLRRTAERDELLRSCYASLEPSNRPLLRSWQRRQRGTGIAPNQARRVFYAVFGHPFSAFAVPTGGPRAGRGRAAGGPAALEPRRVHGGRRSRTG